MESKEACEKYKRDKREVLAAAILSMLNDLTLEGREHILEDHTPEEVADYCQSIYNSEFDLNVETLGIAGANEIAWEEALGIFREVE
jgi:hypothetical protein